MAFVMQDQAAGLRRLFSRGAVRTVAFASGARQAARSALVGDVAVALARRGSAVCVVDQGDAGAASRLGLRYRHDLAVCLERGLAPEEVAVSGPEGVRCVAARQLARLLPELDAEGEARLGSLLRRAHPAADFVLLDVAAAHSDAGSAWAAACSEIVVVVQAAPEGVTEAYAVVKRLSRGAARQRFHIVVTGATEAEHARAICATLGATAQRFLSVRVAWLGWLPPDEDMATALRLRQAVASAFPASRSAGEIGAIADMLIGWPYPGEDGLDGFAHRLREMSRVTSSENA
jgi:flagellar biosynthesis protein FlhG